MCSFSFLRTWNAQWYPAIFASLRIASLISSLLRVYVLYQKNKNRCFGEKRKKEFWTTNPFFSGLRMYFYWLWYLIWSYGCIFSMSHWVLTFFIDFSSFYNGLKHLCSLKLVSILRAALWKVVMKCKIVMFFNSWGFFSENVHFWGCKILSHQL